MLAGVGAGLLQRELAAIPATTVLALWFTLGGHLVEVLFLNRLCQHLHGGSATRVLARIVYWFFGGAVLFAGASATRVLLTGQRTIPLSWWQVALAFVGVELLVHLGAHARGRPSIYNGLG